MPDNISDFDRARAWERAKEIERELFEKFTKATEDEQPSVIKDSGSRTQFETGAQRDCHEGKGRMDLLPVRALIEVAKVYEEGARKYEARNWEKGIPLSRFMDSGLRHAMKWLKGDRDEPHLAQACWNFLCGLDTLKRIEDGLLPESLNDLPNPRGTPRGIPGQPGSHSDIPAHLHYLEEEESAV